MHDFLVRASRVGEAAHGEDLPQEDSERPNVRLGAEETVDEGFRRHPLNRNHRLAALPVVVRPKSLNNAEYLNDTTSQGRGVSDCFSHLPSSLQGQFKKVGF